MLKRLFYSLFGIAVVLYIWCTLFSSFWFFSINGSKTLKGYEEWFPNNIDHNKKGTDDMSSLLKDLALIGWLIIPHSIFARGGTKKALGMHTNPTLGISLYRSMYNLHAASAIHLLIT